MLLLFPVRVVEQPTCLGKSYLFGSPCVSFMDVYQLVHVLHFLLVLGVGCVI